VAQLVGGYGGVRMCERCVTNGIAKLASTPVIQRAPDVAASDTVVFCAFCGKTAQEVPLTGSVNHDVCAECLVKSAEIMLKKTPLLPTSRKWR
jgi:hypothetical protein